MEALQTDVMRFVAILGLCLAAIFSLVQRASLEQPAPVIDPAGPERGDSRGLRGGRWFLSGRYLRSASRCRIVPGYSIGGFGFRLARGQKQEGKQGSEAGQDRRSGA